MHISVKNQEEVSKVEAKMSLENSKLNIKLTKSSASKLVPFDDAFDAER